MDDATRWWTTRASALLLAAGLVGCQASNDGDDADDANPQNALEDGTIYGAVVDANGDPLEGVTVALGDRSAVSDAAGTFTLAAEAGPLVLTFAKPGYVRGLERVDGFDDAPTSIRVTMLDEAPALPFDSSAGGIVAGMRGSTMQAPADAFRDRAGNPVTGMVDVHLTPMNPADRAELAGYPGDGTARTADGTVTKLETFGVLDVTVRQGDTDLTIRDGMEVEIRVPIPDPPPAELPPTVPLWGFDEDAGTWVEEGIATLEASGSAYVGSIGHLSPWNCDQPMATTCIEGRAVDGDGRPLAGTYFMGFGVDYVGDSGATADADGRFAMAVRTESTIEVTAHRPGGLALTREVDSGTAIAPLPVSVGGTGCLDVGDWVFADGGNADQGWVGGDVCFDEGLRARLDMSVRGDLDGDLVLGDAAAAWLCGGALGTARGDSTTVMFFDAQRGLWVGIVVDARVAQTGTALAGSVMFMDLGEQSFAVWSTPDAGCTIDLTRNDLLGPGFFYLEGRGTCDEPAAGFPGGSITVDGPFSFSGLIYGESIDPNVLLECCNPWHVPG